MENNYEITLRFHEDTASREERKVYDEFVKVYEPSSTVGNKQNGITSVIIPSELELTQKGLERFLGGIITIASFKKLE